MPDKEDYENDQCEFIEKIITIIDDKINVKDGNRLFGSDISGVGVPSWDIKTYD